MSNLYNQQTFGQPTFTDAHANGSSSGRDTFDVIDSSNLYYDPDRAYHAGGETLQQMQITTHDEYSHDQHFAYALQDSSVSVAGKITPPSVFSDDFPFYTHTLYTSYSLSPICLMVSGERPVQLGCRFSMTFGRERMACFH